MPAPRVFCSEVATNSSMHGTAEQVDAWLLLEYKPSWAAKAIPDGQLAPATKHWLEQTQQKFLRAGMRLRPQLVRQPELDRDTTRLLLSARGALYEFEAVGYDFLLELDLLDAVGGASIRSLAPPAEVVGAPLYFVCTNGKRDLCCSRYGLPVYQRLREMVGDRVWQVTHLGGHRFAPNVLVIPQNILYGRVQLDDVENFVSQVELGQVDFGHLRGRTQYSQGVQAAEALVGEQQLRLLHVQGAAEQPGSKLQVEFASPKARHTVELRRSEAPQMIQGSCNDTATKAYYPFETLG